MSQALQAPELKCIIQGDFVLAQSTTLSINFILSVPQAVCVDLYPLLTVLFSLLYSLFSPLFSKEYEQPAERAEKIKSGYPGYLHGPGGRCRDYKGYDVHYGKKESESEELGVIRLKPWVGHIFAAAVGFKLARAILGAFKRERG